MTTFKSIEQWLSTNPSQEEQSKVIALINKGAVNQTRHEIYELQKYYNKLQRGESIMKKLGFEPTKEVVKLMNETKLQIVELSKTLPETVKRAKKEKVVKVEE
jgi:hypothetical protein